MLERERNNEWSPAGQGGSGDGVGGDNGLSEARSRGEAYARAGDDALRKAMSLDSSLFLRSNLQDGGQ